MKFSYKKWYWQLWWRSAAVGAGAFLVGAALVVLLAFFQGSKSTADTQSVGQILDMFGIGFGILANYAVVAYVSCHFVKSKYPHDFATYRKYLAGIGAVVGGLELIFMLTPFCLVYSFLAPATALAALELTRQKKTKV